MRNPALLAAAACLIAACAQPVKRTDVAAKEWRPYCLGETGSRIPPKSGECINQPGRVIDREEIEHTGAVNTADLIRQTVPQAH